MEKGKIFVGGATGGARFFVGGGSCPCMSEECECMSEYQSMSEEATPLYE